MNLLVYKNDAHTTSARDMSQVAPQDAPVSTILFNRLDCKDEERYSDYSQRELYGGPPGRSSHSAAGNLNRGGAGGNIQGSLRRNGGCGLSYSDWLKAKDAEKRLKRKLVN